MKKAQNAPNAGTNLADPTTLYAEDWNALSLQARQFSPLDFWRSVLVYQNKFERVSLNNNAWKSIAYSPIERMFVAVAGSGSSYFAMFSKTGVDWMESDLTVGNDWRSICYSRELNLFIAVASSGTGNRIAYGYNGFSWDVLSSPADNDWSSVCWSPELGLFCGVGSDNSVAQVFTTGKLSVS